MDAQELIDEKEYNLSRTADVECIARIVHEANRAYCKTIGDDSQVSWDAAPDWQKLSAITGVQFRIDNPDVSAAEMHASWLKYKTAEGWTYGEVKDAEKKTHPCMVPYDELSQKHRVKDDLFLAIVDIMVSN